MKEIEVEDWAQNGNKKVLTLNPLKDPAEQFKRQWKLSQKLRNKLKYSTCFAEATAKEIEELKPRSRRSCSIRKPIAQRKGECPEKKPKKPSLGNLKRRQGSQFIWERSGK